MTGDVPRPQAVRVSQAGLVWPARSRLPSSAEPDVDAVGCLAGGCGLRSVLLRLAQLGDRHGQPHETRGQGDRLGYGAIGVPAAHRQEPRGGAQPVPVVGAARDFT